MNIEIFLHQPVDSDLIAWLGRRLGTAELLLQDDDVRVYATGSGVRSTITPNVSEGRFVSVFLVGADLPWGNDEDCAREAADELGVTVRSAVVGQDQRDMWFERSAKGDAVVPWDAEPP